jgi:hypothetical protein
VICASEGPGGDSGGAAAAAGGVTVICVDCGACGAQQASQSANRNDKNLVFNFRPFWIEYRAANRRCRPGSVTVHGTACRASADGATDSSHAGTDCCPAPRIPPIAPNWAPPAAPRAAPRNGPGVTAWYGGRP